MPSRFLRAVTHLSVVPSYGQAALPRPPPPGRAPHTLCVSARPLTGRGRLHLPHADTVRDTGFRFFGGHPEVELRVPWRFCSTLGASLYSPNRMFHPSRRAEGTKGDEDVTGSRLGLQGPCAASLPGAGGGAVRHTVCLVLLLCYRGKGCTFWMTSLLVATKH